MIVSKMILMTGNLPFVRRKNRSRYEKMVSGFLIITAMVLIWTQGTSGEIQPNLTTVETWSDTQIKVTWPPSVEQLHVFKPYHYELYIDDHLEYFGNDVMYVARRLTPDTVYYFKLRLCVQNTNECAQFSKTLPGTTAPSQKRSFTKSFLQWLIVCLVVTFLACTTAVIGMKISRKLWRSFLYKYDYTSQNVVGLPKYLNTTDGLDDEETSSLWVDTQEQLHQRGKEKHTDHLEIQENKLPLIAEEGDSLNTADSEQGSITEQSCNVGLNLCEQNLQSNASPTKLERPNSMDTLIDNLENEEIPNTIDGDKSSNFLQVTQKALPGNCKDHILKIGPPCPKEKNSGEIPEQNIKQKSPSGSQLKSQPEDSEKHHNLKNAKLEHISAHNSTLATEEMQDIVVAVDNSNIFIGAQECASLLNPKERKRHIRVKIQQLIKVFERGRTLSRAFVQGSSPPSTEQVWEVYRRLGYCVDLEDRRGKDEQRVDEGLHLHIYKALCELSPRKLVIASGDGNKGKSEGATSLPGCAQAALEKGWLVEVHSWQHSLSTEWIKLSRKYPIQVTIHYLDRYIKNITFVDGKHGRRCQPFPTDNFKRMS